MLRIVLLLFTALLVAAPAMARNLGAGEAYALTAKRPDLVLLDVRTPQEYRQGHLAGARLIPVNEILRRLDEVPKGQPVLVYCAVGSRSAQVYNLLARRGYAEVYNLDGGIYAWAARGYPLSR